MKGRKRGILIAILSLALVIVGCSTQSAEPEGTAASEETNDSTATGSDENVGGELRVALDAQPSILDPHMTAETVTRDTARLVFEPLLTTDSKYQPVPMLAESVEQSDDNKTYTFYLRKGVTFHNGKEMTSEDVVASMNRWKKESSAVGEVFAEANFEAEDEYTVTLQLPEPSATALDVMASAKQFAAIMPKEVIEAAPAEGVSEYIGTGPFEFVEWKHDQYIHFAKYDDYQPVEEEADGLAGKKEALVDDIYFDIVTDPSTRLAGLQTGEYDIAYQMPYDYYEQLKDDSGLKPYTEAGGSQVLIYNKKEGLFTDVKMRQAVNAALDFNEIMLASFSHDELYSLDSGYMDKDIAHWASDAGMEAFNQKDPEKAQKMLEEAGYNGEKIRLLTTRDYEDLYNVAVVVKEQLEQIGMKVELEVYDWATLIDRQEDPKAWELFTNSFSPVSTPSQLIPVNNVRPAGWTDDPEITRLLKAIETSKSQEEATEHWDELQGYLWTEYLPLTQFGTYKELYASTDKVEGFTVFSGCVFWNTKINK